MAEKLSKETIQKLLKEIDVESKVRKYAKALELAYKATSEHPGVRALELKLAEIFSPNTLAQQAVVNNTNQ